MTGTEVELYLPFLEKNHNVAICGVDDKSSCDCDKCKERRKKKAEKLKRLLELDELTNNLPAVPQMEDVPYFENA